MSYKTPGFGSSRSSFCLKVVPVKLPPGFRGYTPYPVHPAGFLPQALSAFLHDQQNPVTDQPISPLGISVGDPAFGFPRI
jgi:hypothetical protein